MIKAIQEYTIDKLALRSKLADFLLATNQHGEKSILKILHKNKTTEKAPLLENEYQLLSKISSPFVLKCFEQRRFQKRDFLVMEDFKGITLQRYISSSPCPKNNEGLIEKLSLTLKLIKAIEDIHSAGIIHKNICTSNILINKSLENIKFINFENASLSKNYHFVGERTEHFFEYPAYISPEQTGQINSKVDYRTDYYSIGIVIYQLFCGQTPFEADSLREWFYNHIAKVPIALNKMNPAIPKILSDVIMKLLQKNAQDRYISTSGIIKDIKRCISGLKNEGIIIPFIPGIEDQQGVFKLSEKIYGRQEEIEELTRHIIEPHSSAARLILLSGNFGVGKSRLISELQTPVFNNNGFFSKSKLEPGNRHLPYSGFLKGINKILQFILRENEQELIYWQHSINKSLGNNSSLLFANMPELELIVGKQEAPPTLAPSESQIRLLSTISDLVNVFLSKFSSLVLFLDDIQWLDIASVDLIEYLFIKDYSKKLNIIGAYDSNESTNNCSLSLILDKFLPENNSVLIKTLSPLSEEDINQLLADSFNISKAGSNRFAQIILQKTNGNPYFIKEFLHELHQNKLIQFNHQKAIWEVSLNEAMQYKITDNVVKLLEQKFSYQTNEIKDLLKKASCIGAEFDVNTLSYLLSENRDSIRKRLEHATLDTFIFPVEKNKDIFVNPKFNTEFYRFTHNTLLAKIYSDIPPEERNKIHKHIGDFLLKNLNDEKEQDPNHVFTVVKHLNKGVKHITKDEHYAIAELNYKACKHAKKSGAFNQALNLIKVSVDLIDDSVWRTNYQLAYDIHREEAEAYAICGKYDKLYEVVSKAEDFIQNPIDLSGFAEIKISAYIAQHNQPKAVETALEILQLLGEKFPKKPNIVHVLTNLASINSKLRKINSIEKLPNFEIEDREILASMNIISKILSASYYVDSKLFPLLVFRLIDNTFKYGLSSKSPVAFVTYALISYSLGNYKSGTKFGKLGMDMFSRLTDKSDWAQTACIYHSGSMWEIPLLDSVTGLQDAYRFGMSVGDIEYAGASISASFVYSFYAGNEIKDVNKAIDHHKSTLTNFNLQVPNQHTSTLKQFIYNLQYGTGTPYLLNGEYINETKDIEHLIKVNDNTSLNYIYLKKLILAYLFKNYTYALEYALTCRKTIAEVKGIYNSVMFYFFETLTLLECVKDAPYLKKKEFIRKAKRNIKKFKKWNKINKTNFENKYFLLKAELAKVNKQPLLASKLYAKAIESSKQHGFSYDLAISNEQAGLFWLSLDRKDFAKLYLREAYKQYNNWGASAKAVDLLTHFDFISDSGDHKVINTDKNSLEESSAPSKSSNVEFETILDAAKSISSDIKYTNLIKNSLSIILEHAGAQRGVLLLFDDKELSPKAIGKLKNNKIQVKLDDFPSNTLLYPLSAINYVQRTQNSLLLNNAINESEYAFDPYIDKNKTKSLIVLPILHRAKLLGIVYLENNLSTNIFNNHKVKILTVLCTQLAISIENATIFNSLESKVEERTSQIHEKNILLNLQNKKIELAHKQLSELNATKDKFFSIIAHDLRGPIGGVNNLLDVVSDDFDSGDKKEIRKYLEQARKTSKETYNLLNNLLLWSKTQRKEIKTKRAKYNLDQVLQSNLKLIEQRAEFKKVKIINKADKKLHAFFDKDQINTVIRNLLDNAIKYASEGDSIEVSSKSDKNMLILCIKDSGIGMNSEIIDKLFTIDSKQESRPGTNNEKGSGLGLILCKEFVEQNKGKIWVESKINQGASFSFSIPIKKD